LTAGACCAVRGQGDRCEGTALLYQEAENVVAAWREVKRDIAAEEPGSPEYVTLLIEARQLQDEFQRLIDGVPFSGWGKGGGSVRRGG
jgi:hypothetical protein